MLCLPWRDLAAPDSGKPMIVRIGSPLEGLDLDDAGAIVGQESSGVGGGVVGTELEDGHSGQRRGPTCCGFRRRENASRLLRR